MTEKNLDVVIGFAKELTKGKDQPPIGNDWDLWTDASGNVYKIKRTNVMSGPSIANELFGGVIEAMKNKKR